ncbi:LysR family transcriptional regulator [Sphingomonas sp. AOB5]|uniref:LysR family transcriptional regulator n=1 Tax=Sphingomonas sp. AOB5 TaxID=3034017 RepID=UPI0023F6BA7A|nr:LysR family transcriptional regulator [Sphingomonas sp. AOB5]MDF7776968.1 LysR family transcriptional regulator [Sphingomonas sp. AOB5]
MIDWQDIRIFSALANAGSLTAAAQNLGLSHTTVGRRVLALEEALKLSLIDRNSPGATLTGDGSAIARLADQMADIVEEIRERSATAQGIGGKVTVAGPPTLLGNFIIPRLAELREAHPELEIIVSTIGGVETEAPQHADLSIRMIRPEQPAHLLRRLGAITFALYAVAEVVAQPRENWTFIGYEGEYTRLAQQRWLADYAGYRPFQFRTSDLPSQLAAARAGLGIALLPSFLADREPSLIPADPGAVPPRRTIWLSTHAPTRRMPATSLVADHLAMAFAADQGFNPPGR